MPVLNRQKSMVSYQAWTSIVFDVVQEQGASFTEARDAQLTISVAAEVWNEKRAELQVATPSEAKRVAMQEVSVS